MGRKDGDRAGRAVYGNPPEQRNVLPVSAAARGKRSGVSGQAFHSMGAGAAEPSAPFVASSCRAAVATVSASAVNTSTS
jgi:hypothetical protein